MTTSMWTKEGTQNVGAKPVELPTRPANGLAIAKAGDKIMQKKSQNSIASAVNNEPLHVP